MAYNNINPFTETYIAGEDLSAKQYYFVTLSGADVVLADNGEEAVGVLWNSPASGQAATVVRGGDPHVYAGTSLAAGIDIGIDATGRAVVAASGDFIVGKTRAAADAAGDLVQIHFSSVGTEVA